MKHPCTSPDDGCNILIFRQWTKDRREMMITAKIMADSDCMLRQY